MIQDLQTGWTYQHQSARALPAASVIKLPIMVACFQAAQAGTIHLTQSVPLRSRDRAAGSGSLKTMPVGAAFTVEQLI